MAQRSDLLEELKVKLDILIKDHQRLEQLEALAQTLKAENESLKKQYSELKTATSLVDGNQDMRETKLYVSRLIREIDKCISLLNA